MKEKLVLAYCSFIENTIKTVLSWAFSIMFKQRLEENNFVRSKRVFCKVSRSISSYVIWVSANILLDCMFFFGLVGIVLSMKIAEDIKNNTKQQRYWIIFQCLALVYQIIFSFKIFEMIGSNNDDLKLFVFIFTLIDVFVIFSISIIFISWENPSESATLPSFSQQVTVKLVEDDLPPSYEEVTQNRLWFNVMLMCCPIKLNLIRIQKYSRFCWLKVR